MVRATTVIAAGLGTVAPTARVILDFDSRHRRRIVMRTDTGLEFLLDLEKAHRLRQGDRLVLEDGRHIEVIAAPEPLTEIRCDDLRHLVRVAWHLGNRHLPTMLDGDRLVIRRDHVIEDMVRGLGAAVAHINAPFNPEGGAYAGGHHHHHGDDDHDHSPRPKRGPPVWSPKEGTP
jgi:urease accessory protein